MKEQLKKLAAHDYAKTAFSYVERDTSHEYWVGSPRTARQHPAPTLMPRPREPRRPKAGRSPRLAALAASTEAIIAAGESKWVEFKQTGRVNLHTNQRDEVIEQQVVKAVAGFMNAEGGTLLIGVSDSGEITGIEIDLKTLGKKQNTDGFAVWLKQPPRQQARPNRSRPGEVPVRRFFHGNGLPSRRDSRL